MPDSDPEPEQTPSDSPTPIPNASDPESPKAAPTPDPETPLPLVEETDTGEATESGSTGTGTANSNENTPDPDSVPAPGIDNKIKPDQDDIDAQAQEEIEANDKNEKEEINLVPESETPTLPTASSTSTGPKGLTTEELLALCKTTIPTVVLTPVNPGQYGIGKPKSAGTANGNENGQIQGEVDKPAHASASSPSDVPTTPVSSTEEKAEITNSNSKVSEEVVDSGPGVGVSLLPMGRGGIIGSSTSNVISVVPIPITTSSSSSSSSLASSCPNVMAALMNPSTLAKPSPPVIPGTKDSDGFLTPPPASTLLIRRTRTNSTGSSTYVVSSSPARKPPETIPVPPPTPLESLLLQRRQSRKSGDSSRSGRSIKRPKFDDERVEFTSSGSSSSSSGPGVSYVTHPSPHSRGYLPPISPLAIDPTHSLSVTITSDRSVATHISPSSPHTEMMFNNTTNTTSVTFPFAGSSSGKASTSSILKPSSSASTSASVAPMNSKPKVSRGKPAYITENYNGGKGSKKRRSFERTSSIEAVRKRSARRKRLSTENRYSRSSRGSRSMSESSVGVGYELDQGGTWRPADDLRLIVNVLQTNDLESVYLGTKFSCKYTQDNISSRWQLLLYDKPTSKVSQLAIRNLHPKTVASIYSQALFSKEEENLLKAIRSTYDPKSVLPKLEKLLSENALVFLKWRTPKKLFDHWLLLKDYYLLCDQDVSDYFAQESFSDFENSLSDQECKDNIEIDSHARREAIIENRHARRRIRALEEEVGKWEILANMVTEIEPRPFEETSYAMLRGKQVRYLMRSKEITLGRRTSESMNVDAELSMEGSVYKVSRKQATIQLRTLGDFAILNQGKHAIHVDGNIVLPGQLWRLVDNSVIEISRLRFIFLINHKMVAAYRRRQIKTEVKKEMQDLSKLARAIKATAGNSVSNSPSNN